jgi:hypothetical protein
MECNGYVNRSVEIFWTCSLETTGKNGYDSESLLLLIGKEWNAFSRPRQK